MRGTQFLLPMVAAPGSDTVLLGRALLIEKVREWPQRDYGYGDPAHALPMIRIAPALFGFEFSDCERIVRVGATTDALAALMDVVPEPG